MGPTKEKTAIKYISEVYNARSVKKSDTSETLLKIWNLDPNPSNQTSQSVNPTRLSIPTIIYHPDNWPGPTGPSVSINQSIRPNQSIQPAICHQSIISSNLSIIPSRRVIHIYHSHNTPLYFFQKCEKLNRVEGPWFGHFWYYLVVHLSWKNVLDCMPRKRVAAFFVSGRWKKCMGIPIVKPKSQKLP